DLKLIETNVEEAKKLLAEAGWKDSNGDQVLDKMIDGKRVDFKFEIKYMTTTPVWEENAKLMAESMAKANVIAQLVPLQYATWSQEVHNHDFDMMISSWAGSSQPEDMKQIWHSGNWANKGSNFVGFGNAESDALIDSSRVELNEEKRIVMMKKIQSLIYDEQPYIFMFASKRRVIAHKRFGNQEYYYEKPGLLLNNLKLISATP
ncbi:MAG TPA: ABC transporter substrate-binding protein, partial [Bacteroidia bacterium]|nr:ABC transporter substrate-binding protein [Bacteroidia bacterium]